MNNLNEIGLTELNEESLDTINGGSASIDIDLSGLLGNLGSLLSGLLGTVTGLVGGLLGGVLGGVL